MLKTLLFSITLFYVGTIYGQSERPIAFYNVENLFDIVDDPKKNDNEFLPGAENAWDQTRYNEKIAHINQVMDSLGNPMIIGLCEIENKAVVQDVVKYGAMRQTHGVVHYESLDERGIDNAIIYDSSYLTLASSGIIRFEMPAPSTPSRDIVWAKFTRKSDTILVMVNHWPSRSGGTVESEPKRMIAALAASHFIDSVLVANKNMKIVFMGDLNDHPEDRCPMIIAKSLEPMIVASSGEYGGSHQYKGEWAILDHIYVSKAFLKKKGIHMVKNSGKIHSPAFLLSTYKDEIVPNRTYGGKNYLGGYSDHLPVSIGVKL